MIRISKPYSLVAALGLTYIVAAAGVTARCATINLGILSYDVLVPSGPGVSGIDAIDISNLTGADLLTPDFPVTTAVTLTNAGLQLNGPSAVDVYLGDIGPGPLLDPGGQPLASLQFPASSQFTSAILTAVLDVDALHLYQDGTDTVDPDITVTLLPMSGPYLQAGVDNIVITTSTSLPEPGTLSIAFAGLGVLYLLLRRRPVRPPSLFGAALAVLVVCAEPHAAAQQNRDRAANSKGGGQVVQAVESPRFCRLGEPCPVIMQPAPWIRVADVPEAETEEAEEGKERAMRGMSRNTSKPVLTLPQARQSGDEPKPDPRLGPEAEAAKPGPKSSGASAKIRLTFKSNSGPPPNPADNNLAVGQQNVITSNNAGIVIFDKTGTQLTQPTSLQTFFGNPPDSPFDPRVIYDEYLHLFWVVAISKNSTNMTSTIFVALSNQEDATAGFKIFSMDGKPNNTAETNLWCDYPTLGLDTQAIYIGCNMFTFAAKPGYQYSKLRVMTKSQFTGNTCCRWWDFFNQGLTDAGGGLSFTLRPAVMHGAKNADGEYVVNAVGKGGSGSSLTVRKITNPANCCIANNQTAPAIAQGAVTVGSFDSPPNAAQPDGVTPLDTGDTRLHFAFWNSGKLTTGQNLAAGAVSAVAFTEIDVSAFPTMNTVDDFAVHLTNASAFYPAAEANSMGMRALVFNTSGTSSYPGASIAGIPADTTCTNCISEGFGIANFVSGDATSFLTAGVDPGGRNRWGDYSGASPDTDGKSVWVFGSYTTGMNMWGTLGARVFTPIVSLKPASLTFAQPVGMASPAQAVTLTNTGDVPLSIASIATSGTACLSINTNSFAQTNTCGASLAAGASCQINVTFTPSCKAAFNGAVSITDDASGSPQVVSLVGTGNAAANLVKLAATTTPATIPQRSEQVISVTGAPFPDNLAAQSVVVTLSSGGSDSCVTAMAVQQVNGANATWRIMFQAPSFLSGVVQVTVSGLTVKGLPFSSSSSSQLNITPAPM